MRTAQGIVLVRSSSLSRRSRVEKGLVSRVIRFDEVDTDDPGGEPVHPVLQRQGFRVQQRSGDASARRNLTIRVNVRTREFVTRLLGQMGVEVRDGRLETIDGR